MSSRYSKKALTNPESSCSSASDDGVTPSLAAANSKQQLEAVPIRIACALAGTSVERDSRGGMLRCEVLSVSSLLSPAHERFAGIGNVAPKIGRSLEFGASLGLQAECSGRARCWSRDLLGEVVPFNAAFETGEKPRRTDDSRHRGSLA